MTFREAMREPMSLQALLCLVIGFGLGIGFSLATVIGFGMLVNAHPPSSLHTDGDAEAVIDPPLDSSV